MILIPVPLNSHLRITIGQFINVAPGSRVFVDSLEEALWQAIIKTLAQRLDYR